jgi:transglutaminase-like putative cysteine protease
VIYDIRHKTTFTYEEVVSVSHHVLHLVPRVHPRQRCLETSLTFEPPQSADSEANDYFGNPVHYLTVQQPHERLVVEARSRVEVFAAEPLNLAVSAPWEAVLHSLGSPESDVLQAHQFAFDSPYVATGDSIQDYAAQSFPSGRPILEAVMDLTGRMFREFEYQGGVSDISTPVQDVLEMRKGVCQDFAHLQIACLRGLGLPARYVSGYVLTRPPEGKEKLIGSDASHAWISVWSGERGWVDFDPTNNLIPSSEHITVAWGRDYGDVSPINGFIVGGGAHQVSVAVDVIPLGSGK